MAGLLTDRQDGGGPFLRVLQLVKEGPPLYRPNPPTHATFSWFHRSLRRSDESSLGEFISREKLGQILINHGIVFGQQLGTVYTPMIVLWGMISQVIHAGHQRTCQAAVQRIVSVMAVITGVTHSANTGAYCRACKKFCFAAIQQIAGAVASCAMEHVSDQAGVSPRGGRLIHADGYTVRALDTPANQAEYPQSRCQKKGLGFPQLRIVSLFHAETGVHLDAAIGPCSGKGTGETALLWSLLPALRGGDTLVADRYFCTYWIIAECQRRGIHVVMRKHARRASTGGAKRDTQTHWKRPVRPSWMTPQTYEQMPEQLTVREVAVKQTRKGYRTQHLTVITTHLNASEHPSNCIAAIYGGRWRVEQDIRSLKRSLGMDFIQAKTPERVRVMIWTCILAYNLIREAMLQASAHTGRKPRSLSFGASLSELACNWTTRLLVPSSAPDREQAIRSRTAATVGNRPGRNEPRAIKMRTQTFPLLTEPRHDARAKLNDVA